MTDNVVNLRGFRKAKARSEKEDQARVNRHKHGRSKPQKDAERLEQDRRKRELDGALRDSDEG